MTFKRRLAQGSATTLGFITGNTPGAFLGYNVGGKLYDFRYGTSPKSTKRSRTMAPVPRVTGSAGNMDIDTTPANLVGNRRTFLRSRNAPAFLTVRSGAGRSGRSRRAVYSRARRVVRRAGRMKRSMKRARHINAKASGQESGRSVFTPGLKSGKKLVFPKRRKVTRVSRKLRAKVRKVMDASEPIGYFQKTYWSGTANILRDLQHVSASAYGTFWPAVSGVVNPQPDAGNGAGTVGQGRLFDPAWVRYAVERMYGGFTAQQDTLPAITGGPAAGAALFNNKNLVVNVTKQWATQVLKNNSRRTLIVKVYEVMPKNNHNEGEPLTHWRDGMSVDRTDANQTNVTRTPGLVGANMNTLHSAPVQCKQWNAQWKCEKTEIILEPGQQFVRHINGPTCVYDFNKFWRSDVLQDWQKGLSVYQFVIIINDIVTGVGASDPPRASFACGRPGEGDNTEGLGIETTLHMRYTLPEQAGLTLPNPVVAGARLANTERIRRYLYEYQQTVPTINEENRIDPNEPQEVAAT